MNKLYAKLIFSSIFFSFFTSATIEFEDAVFPELATSSRALAMGNAYISKVDDSSAVFYNPAGLGTVRYPHLHLSNFHIEFNKDWMGMTTGGNITDSASNLMEGFSIEGQRKLLVENKGKLAHSRFHLLPNFTTRYFSAGYLLSKNTRATIDTAPGAQYEFADRFDHGPYAGLNLSIFGGIIKLGISGIILNRKELIDDVDPDTEIDKGELDYNKGTALILTAGGKITLPMTAIPSLAVTIHNAGAQKFSGRGAGPPNKIKQTVDAGFSLTPQIGKILRIHLEANYKDIGASYADVSSSRKLLLGMEFDLARTFYMRFGYGDGFGSAGLGVRSRALEFDLTTYAVDTTTSAFRGEEDRRFVLSISSGM